MNKFSFKSLLKWKKYIISTIFKTEVSVCLPVCLSHSLSSCHRFSADSSRLQQTFLRHYTELHYCIYYPLTASTTPSLLLLPPYCPLSTFTASHTTSLPWLPPDCKLYYPITAPQDHSQAFTASPTPLLPPVPPHHCTSVPFTRPSMSLVLPHCLYYPFTVSFTSSLPHQYLYCPFKTSITPLVPLLYLCCFCYPITAPQYLYQKLTVFISSPCIYYPNTTPSEPLPEF